MKAAGVSWWAYQSFMKKHEREIEEETLVKVPAFLDLIPYRMRKISRCWSAWCARSTRNDDGGAASAHLRTFCLRSPFAIPSDCEDLAR